MSDLGTPTNNGTASPASAVITTMSPLTLCVVPFRLTNGNLQVGIIHRLHEIWLPSGELAPEESLDNGARRIICGDDEGHIPAHGHDHYFEQLYTFGLDTHPLRQIVISYIALFRNADPATDEAEGDAVDWRPVRDVRLDRPIDRLVLDYAITRLRAKLGYTNIAFHLMPQTFTMTELQQAYECVLEHPVDKRNFRRRMTATGILEDTGEKRRDGSHRPAALYRFAARHDQAAYLTPPWATERLGSAAGGGD